MSERNRFSWPDLFIGNKKLFADAFTNPETLFFFDGDAIIIDSPEIVFRKFSKRNKIETSPAEVDKWDFLTTLAKQHNLSKYKIKTAESHWYNPKTLAKARTYLWMKPVLSMTTSLQGQQRNFLLTSREPEFDEVTFGWMKEKCQEIPKENILIRTDSSIKPTDFKVEEIRKRAESVPWVVFIDDSTKYVKAVLDAKIKNCIVVNIPLGKTMPDFTDENLIIIKRYPDNIQAMYPLYHAIDLARRGKLL